MVFSSVSATNIVSVSSHVYFVPYLRRTQRIHTFVVLLLELPLVCELDLGHSELLG